MRKKKLRLRTYSSRTRARCACNNNNNNNCSTLSTFSPHSRIFRCSASAGSACVRLPSGVRRRLRHFARPAIPLTRYVVRHIRPWVHVTLVTRSVRRTERVVLGSCGQRRSLKFFPRRALCIFLAIL